MKRVFISIDMEGLSGVTSDRHRNIGEHFYEWTCKQMIRELSIVVEALKEHGIEDITVNDSHHYMINLRVNEIPSGIKLISGQHKLDSMMEGLTDEYDGSIFIGYHAMAGTHGVLSHTYSDSIHSLTVNGTPAGETTLNAAFCGCFDIPVLIVSGDDFVKKEVDSLGTGTETVITKQALTRTSAIFIDPATLREKYYQAVERAVSKSVKPFKLKPPYRFEVTLRETQMVDMALRVPGTVKKDDTTISFEVDDYITGYRAFLAIQVIASASYLE